MSPGILLQEELDDAVLLAREVIQRLVNDILRDGIPIPIHPLFKLNKPLVNLSSILKKKFHFLGKNSQPSDFDQHKL